MKIDDMGSTAVTNATKALSIMNHEFCEDQGIHELVNDVTYHQKPAEFGKNEATIINAIHYCIAMLSSCTHKLIA